MPFVLDASVAVTWAFEDENHPDAALALARLKSDTARVPSLWCFELRNALLVNERRGRLTEAGTDGFLRDVGRLAIGIDRSPDETAVLTLARRRRLAVYDAAYVELAQRQGLPLASLDNPVRRAAAAGGVALLGG